MATITLETTTAPPEKKARLEETAFLARPPARQPAAIPRLINKTEKQTVSAVCFPLYKATCAPPSGTPTDLQKQSCAGVKNVSITKTRNDTSRPPPLRYQRLAGSGSPK